uniref:Uncharacterized protein n=1 Tax=Rhizophagus irregularis (strain DAOM 181602 / DAOM 197198 / MUCL 43194) TaxID=747089 RepID=U9UJE8_RHIID
MTVLKIDMTGLRRIIGPDTVSHNLFCISPFNSNFESNDIVTVQDTRGRQTY